jgi:integrase
MYLGISEDVSRAKTNNSLQFHRAPPRLSAQMYLVLSKSGDIPRVKGSIAKTYPLQPDDLRCLRAYLQTRDDDSPYLFISTRGIPLKRRSYWDLMQKHGQVAAIPKSKRRFHALRHAWT